MAGNRFSVQPADLSPIMGGIGSIVKQNREAQRKKQTEEGFMEAYRSGDPDKVAEFSIKNPEFSKIMDKRLGFRDEKTKDNFVTTTARALSDPANALNYMQDRVDYLKSVNGDPTQTLKAMEMYQQDPEGSKKMMEMSLAQNAPKMYEAYKDQRGVTSSDLPSNVREWQYYSKLTPDQQKKYRSMKRSTFDIKEIAGVPTQIEAGTSPTLTPLSTQTKELGALADKTSTVESIKGLQSRQNELAKSRSGRRASIKKAEKFLKLFKDRNMKSGAGRSAANYVPGVYTDQGALDEEFNSFSEVAARQALKASGELRPTDADVEGMKRAMFGIGRDESVNIQLLDDYLEQQQYDEEEFKSLKAGKTPIVKRKEVVQPPQQGQQAAPQGGTPEGTTATNPQTGQKVIYQNGQWQPAS